MRVGFRAAAAILLLAPMSAFALEGDNDVAKWFQDNGNNCPQIDDVDSHIRDTNKAFGNTKVIEETVKAFSVLYHSEQCTPSSTSAQYTGEAVYNAIVNDYKSRHADAPVVATAPAAQSPAVPAQPIPFAPEPDNSFFVGKWVGTETCRDETKKFTLDIALDQNGQMQVDSLVPYGRSERPFDEVEINGNEIKMVSESFLGDAEFEGKLVSETRMEGEYHRPFEIGWCEWYAVKQ